MRALTSVSSHESVNDVVPPLYHVVPPLYHVVPCCTVLVTCCTTLVPCLYRACTMLYRACTMLYHVVPCLYRACTMLYHVVPCSSHAPPFPLNVRVKGPTAIRVAALPHRLHREKCEAVAIVPPRIAASEAIPRATAACPTCQERRGH